MATFESYMDKINKLNTTDPDKLRSTIDTRYNGGFEEFNTNIRNSIFKNPFSTNERNKLESWLKSVKDLYWTPKTWTTAELTWTNQYFDRYKAWAQEVLGKSDKDIFNQINTKFWDFDTYKTKATTLLPWLIQSWKLTQDQADDVLNQFTTIGDRYNLHKSSVRWPDANIDIWTTKVNIPKQDVDTTDVWTWDFSTALDSEIKTWEWLASNVTWIAEEKYNSIRWLVDAFWQRADEWAVARAQIISDRETWVQATLAELQSSIADTQQLETQLTEQELNKKLDWFRASLQAKWLSPEDIENQARAQLDQYKWQRTTSLNEMKVAQAKQNQDILKWSNEALDLIKQAESANIDIDLWYKQTVMDNYKTALETFYNTAWDSYEKYVAWVAAKGVAWLTAIELQKLTSMMGIDLANENTSAALERLSTTVSLEALTFISDAQYWNVVDRLWNWIITYDQALVELTKLAQAGWYAWQNIKSWYTNAMTNAAWKTTTWWDSTESSSWVVREWWNNEKSWDSWLIKNPKWTPEEFHADLDSAVSSWNINQAERDSIATIWDVYFVEIKKDEAFQETRTEFSETSNRLYSKYIIDEWMDFDIMIAKLKEGKNFKTYSPENKEKLLRSLQEHHNDVLTKPETNPDIINFISKNPLWYPTSLLIGFEIAKNARTVYISPTSILNSFSKLGKSAIICNNSLG